jgi:hypothetical protein
MEDAARDREQSRDPEEPKKYVFPSPKQCGRMHCKYGKTDPNLTSLTAY